MDELYWLESSIIYGDQQAAVAERVARITGQNAGVFDRYPMLSTEDVSNARRTLESAFS